MLKDYNHLKIACLFILLTAVCFSQTIISIEQQTVFRANQTFPTTVKEVRDLNNTLDKFLGSWSGQFGNFEFDLEVNKVNYYNSYTDIDSDKLNISFLIKDILGNILVNSENSDLTGNMFWIGINEKGEHEFRLHDKCSNGITVIMQPYYPNEGLIPRDINNPESLLFYMYKGNMGGMTNGNNGVPTCIGISQYFPILGEVNSGFSVQRE